MRTGSLITNSVVLTAAHCVDWATPQEIDVAAGQTLLSAVTPSDRLAVAEIAIHPDWVIGGADETDLALLRLTEPIAGATTVLMEDSLTEPTLHRLMIGVGWGFIDPDRTVLVDAMQAAPMLAASSPSTHPATTSALCLVVAPADDFCIGSNTTGICQGDSGGPVLAETFTDSGVFEVVGVVSFGPAAQCLHPTIYDAAQSVAPYRPWIDSTTTAWAAEGVTLPTAPGAPTVDRGNGTATLTWTAPDDDGGDPDLSYTVTGSPAGTCTTSLLTCEITGLTNGVAHSFTVAATNAAGAGPASAPTGATVLAAVLAAVLFNCSGTVPHPFSDVGTSFASNDIGCIAELEVTKGISPTTYSPDDDVTREQMAAFIARLYREITG